MRNMKHYVGIGPARIAGVRGRIDGHYFTADPYEQKRIESHPSFVSGAVKLAVEEAPKPDDTDFSSYGWNELRKAARDRGIKVANKSRAQIIKELGDGR